MANEIRVLTEYVPHWQEGASMNVAQIYDSKTHNILTCEFVPGNEDFAIKSLKQALAASDIKIEDISTFNVLKIPDNATGYYIDL